MISYAAFWFVPLLSIHTTPVSAACNSTVSCLCGSTNNTYSLCVDAVRNKENPCDVWSNCRTCQENLTHCATCPENRTGPMCLEVKRIRKKRQYVRSGRQTSFYGSCPRLESPDLGSISCRRTNNFRSCTGRCLPGYSFADSTQEQITLQCSSGKWTPRHTFPPCISGGHCNLKIKGAGSFNCTTGMDGTRCDVFCNGMYRSRYHCFPGRRWTPSLPYCVRPKEGSSSERPPPPCPCQNDGFCNSMGDCVCPKGWTGTYCDKKEREERPSCPDPGFPSGGYRVTGDGTPAPLQRGFNEGESVVFSCRDRDTALQGVSLIRCRADGTWSAPRPQCVRDPSVICPDPGIVSNGDRINTDESPSTPDHVYTPGQSVVYNCRGGYRLRGNSMRTCMQTGQWSGSTPRCSRMGMAPGRPPIIDETTCRHPEPDINGFIEGYHLLDPPRRNRYPPGSQLTFGCEEGYRPIGAITLYCRKTGDWTSVPPTCEETARLEPVAPPESNRMTCRQPGVDPNGKIEETVPIDPRRTVQRFLPGSELTYTCNDGYYLNGPRVIFCLLSGEWSSSPPTCTRTEGSENQPLQNCPNVEPAKNSEVTIIDETRRPGKRVEYEPEDDDSDFLPGTHLHFSCRDKFIIIGSNSLVCLPTGHWNTDPPFCVEDCGRSLMRTTRKLSKATRTEPGQWPWTVAIAATSNNVIICGGALIDNRTVLTAAHCLYDYPFYTLYFGKFYRKDERDDGKVKTRRSTRILIHEDYDNVTYDNDIALLRFEPSVVYSERIKPICLPTPNSTAKNVIPGNTGSVAGLGYNEKRLLSEELMVAHLPVQPDDECMDAYKEHGLGEDMHFGMFCAGDTEGVVNTCRGDSGSPLVFLDGETHRYTIEGLVSFGQNIKQCDEKRVYTVFTKVGHYMPWILENWPSGPFEMG